MPELKAEDEKGEHQGRFQPVTIPYIYEKGITKFAWLGAKEFGIEAPHGAFLYVKGDRQKKSLRGRAVYLPLMKPSHKDDDDKDNPEANEATFKVPQSIRSLFLRWCSHHP